MLWYCTCPFRCCLLPYSGPLQGFSGEATLGVEAKESNSRFSEFWATIIRERVHDRLIIGAADHESIRQYQADIRISLYGMLLTYDDPCIESLTEELAQIALNEFRPIHAAVDASLVTVRLEDTFGAYLYSLR